MPSIETPIRHWRLPSKQSVGAGLAVVVATVLILTVVISSEAVAVGGYNVKPAGDARVVRTGGSRGRSHHLTSQYHSASGVASLCRPGWDIVEQRRCIPTESSSHEAICVLGDPKGHRLIVLYGDSHALMWRPAFGTIARRAHWRLVILAKPSCPAALVSVEDPPSMKLTGRFTACDQWHQWAVNWINKNKPQLVVATQLVPYPAPGASPKIGPEITPAGVAIRVGLLVPEDHSAYTRKGVARKYARKFTACSAVPHRTPSQDPGVLRPKVIGSKSFRPESRKGGLCGLPCQVHRHDSVVLFGNMHGSHWSL